MSPIQKVVILGGGVAGLSAAHELIERGFQVEVYEANPVYFGGKARSEDHTGISANPLPGEHGFRFFPGFYRHITHTMKRIPFGAGTCYDNLVTTERILIARNGQEPIKIQAEFPFTAAGFNLVLSTLSGADTGLTGPEKKLFKNKLFQLLTTSKERFESEYEQQAWWYFVEAHQNSPNYQNLLADGLTRSLVAAQAKKMSTRVGGGILLQLIYDIVDPGIPADRVLNGPTNQQWIQPWISYLQAKGVQFFLNHTASALNVDAVGRLQSVRLDNPATGIPVYATGDYFILAVPVEKAKDLLDHPVITNRDPILAYPVELSKSVRWMNGIQFYLSTEIPLNPGHIIHIHSPWAVTSISQVQYWSGYDIDSQSGGLVKGVLSVDVSDWQDGIYNGKRAKDTSEAELIQSTYEQIQQSLIVGGVPLLPANRADVVVGYHIASSIRRTGPTQAVSDEPLLVNTVNSWDLMPKSFTGIPNLFLAGDYVRTFTGLATMEAANESARRAVNCILSASGTGKPYAKVWRLREWAMVLPYKWWDRRRYSKGLPYSSGFPWWLHVIAFIWSIICLVAWAIGLPFRWLFGFI